MLIRLLLFPLLLWSCTSIGQSRESAAAAPVIVGAERPELYLPILEGKTVGLVVNHTSQVGNEHLVDFLLAEGVQVATIFAPEHGFRGEADAGAHVEDGRDAQTGLPIISLYGSHRKPTADNLHGLDIVIFDIQDVGVRFYTYISTMSYVMASCAEQGIPFMVFDRPNPNGNLIDGPVMQGCCNSFIGLHPGVPVAHGMTVGEYAQMVNEEGWLDTGRKVDLTVIGMDNWTHDTPYELPIKPSPNLPNMRSIYLYPTLCFFEATVMSVGRGTTKQFQLIGHPDYPGDYTFTPEPMPGAQNPKLKGQTCKGIDYSYWDVELLRQDTLLHLDWLIEVYQNFPDKDNFFLAHFYKLAGNHELQEQIQAGLSPAEIRITWREEVNQFKTMREKYLLYP